MSAATRRRWQRGDAVGSIVVLAVLVVAGYFVYKYFISTEQPALNCKQQFNRCEVECRKTATENEQMQSCLRECDQKLAACKD